MDIPILFEDSNLVVINKPPGIVVNRAESVKGETIQDWVENQYTNVQMYQSATEFVSRAGIVHRIDKETSGILLIAKTPEAFVELQRQFKERIVKKTYLAIVHGNLAPVEGEIHAPVGRLPWNRERFGIVPGGKDAVTRYKVIQVFFRHAELDSASALKPTKIVRRNDGEDQLSLVELYPETGRTHQIRVHMKYINHPILGDYLYAGRKVSRDDRTWVPRVMLHAWKIIFNHPVTGSPLALEAPMPDDMKRVLSE